MQRPWEACTVATYVDSHDCETGAEGAAADPVEFRSDLAEAEAGAGPWRSVSFLLVGSFHARWNEAVSILIFVSLILAAGGWLLFSANRRETWKMGLAPNHRRKHHQPSAGWRRLAQIITIARRPPPSYVSTHVAAPLAANRGGKKRQLRVSGPAAMYPVSLVIAIQREVSVRPLCSFPPFASAVASRHAGVFLIEPMVMVMMMVAVMMMMMRVMRMMRMLRMSMV